MSAQSIVGGPQLERAGSTNAQFVCEIRNVNTVEHIRLFTDSRVFFSCFNIELCVFIIRYQLSCWNTQFLRKAAFVFKACRFSASASCLLCMHLSGFPPVPTLYKLYALPVRICITRESYHQYPRVISSVPVRICSTRESYPQYP